ncbi:hypothetical protein Tco_0279310 [Tanacetum coccineum]
MYRAIVIAHSLWLASPASSGSSVPVKSEPRSGGFVANMVATVADGYIWATGSAMTHRAMDAIVGPRTIQIKNVPVAQCYIN